MCTQSTPVYTRGDNPHSFFTAQSETEQENHRDVFILFTKNNKQTKTWVHNE